MRRRATIAERLRLRTLIDRTARDQGVTREALLGPCRIPLLARARFAIAWVAHGQLGLSHRDIGEQLGDRHHSTIENSVIRAKGLRETDPAFRAMTDRLAPPMRETTDA